MSAPPFDESRFTEPDWTAPLDMGACLRAVPATATMTGMFLDAVAKLARERGRAPTKARERYVSFQAYPLREHCELLVEVASALFPDDSPRLGLRKLGRGAPHVLLQSTVGRVVLGSVEGAHAMIEAMAKSYMMHMRPGEMTVERLGERGAMVRAVDIHNFLDCHNVGVFEGVLKLAEVRGTVKIRSYGRATADLLCRW